MKHKQGIVLVCITLLFLLSLHVSENPNDLTLLPIPQSLIWKFPERAGRTIQHFHFHKCGGMALCKLAIANGEKTEHRSTCGPFNMKHSYDLPCKQQERQVKVYLDKGLTFMTREFKFHWLQRCKFENIMTFAVVRDPISRLASQYEFREMFHNHSARYWTNTRSVHKLLPNFQTRRILNLLDNREARAEMTRNRYTLTQNDADRAILLLSDIDVVLPMERLCEAEPILQAAFGWSNFSIFHQASDRNHIKKPHEVATFKGDLTELEHQNFADTLLWRKANEHMDRLLATLPKDLEYAKPECPQLQYRYLDYDKPLQPSQENYEGNNM